MTIQEMFAYYYAVQEMFAYYYAGRLYFGNVCYPCNNGVWRRERDKP